MHTQETMHICAKQLTGIRKVYSIDCFQLLASLRPGALSSYLRGPRKKRESGGDKVTWAPQLGSRMSMHLDVQADKTQLGKMLPPPSCRCLLHHKSSQKMSHMKYGREVEGAQLA